MKKIILSLCLIMCLYCFIGCNKCIDSETINKAVVTINDTKVDTTSMITYCGDIPMTTFSDTYYVYFEYEGIIYESKTTSDKYKFCKEHIGEELKFDLDKNEYEDGKLTYKIKNIYGN